MERYKPVTWAERVDGQQRRVGVALLQLADALRAAVADQGPGYFSYRQLRDCYGGPPCATAATVVYRYHALLAQKAGVSRIEHWRQYRERAAGVEVTR